MTKIGVGDMVGFLGKKATEEEKELLIRKFIFQLFRINV